MKNKILGSMLIISIMLVLIIPITYAAEEVIDLSGTAFMFVGGGTYKFTGSGWFIEFNSDFDNVVTFDISLEEVVLSDGIHISGYGNIVLNIKIIGDTYLYKGFSNSNTGSTTVNISIEEGALYLPTGLYTGEDMNVDISADNLCIDEENIDDINYEVYRNGHEAGTTVIENKVKATCTEDGSYDRIVYCSVCEEEFIRETVTETATGHVEGEAVKENEVEATTENEGSYDEVVYCQECGKELSRTTVEVAYVTEETVDETYENIDTENEEKTESVAEEVTEEENETTSNPTTGDTIAVFITIFAVAIVGLVTTLVIRKRIK